MSRGMLYPKIIICFFCFGKIALEAEDFFPCKCWFSGWLFSTAEGIWDSLEALLLVLFLVDVVYLTLNSLSQ